MTVKADEIKLAQHFAQFPAYNRGADVPAMRGVEESWKGPQKRLWFILSKWADRGWVEYGTSIRGCWVTPEGVEPLAKLAEKEYANEAQD